MGGWEPWEGWKPWEGWESWGGWEPWRRMGITNPGVELSLLCENVWSSDTHSGHGKATTGTAVSFHLKLGSFSLASQIVSRG